MQTLPRRPTCLRATAHPAALLAPILLALFAAVFVAVVLALCSRPAFAQGAVAAAAAESVPDTSGEVDLVVFNRKITTFRGTFLGTSPEGRARRTQQAIADVLALGGSGEITVRSEPQGNVLLVDGQLVLFLLPEDADRLHGESLDAATKRTVAALEQVLAETREGRDRSMILRAAMLSLAATAMMAVLTWGVFRVRRALRRWLLPLIEAKSGRLKVGGTEVVAPVKLVHGTDMLITLWASLLTLFLAYNWLSFTLARFPYTRPWGEELNGFLFGVVRKIGLGIIGALPDLVVAVIIFLLARAVIRLALPLFERANSGNSSLSWLDPDTVRPTRTLFTLGVWLFAIVMAYPYLPGSGSDAFKGMSVLVGLMVSVGGASLIGQAASGLILMYSRIIRTGEYVRIADTEGTVSELGTFTTKIRTGLGEEVTLPNALVLGTVTKNYSRTVRGNGFILDTTVTIGYDTPWRQVEAMLIEAAQRTPGVLHDPEPRVFQLALSDFYIEYRLVCQAVPSEPLPRAQVLAVLHRNIQDVFNENETQIMSPHYFMDPATPKLVPRPRAVKPDAPDSASALR